MQKERYENLSVYRISKHLADEIWKTVEQWGAFERDEVGERLIQSSDTLASNIARATIDGALDDNIRFAKNARSSLFETKHWLKKAQRRDFLTLTESEEMMTLVDMLTPGINRLIDLLSARKRFGG